ncbi:MAG: hypothetical protein CM1200mP37_1110 [Chloroflexota bacterium]|jgi:hypothetical protein|nr:MAG: hypothetical protein CM1200mP37_1110 [Chloroflexota bacterium]
MREHGFKDVKYPALNADGSINWEPIKQSFGQLDRKNVKLFSVKILLSVLNILL